MQPRAGLRTSLIALLVVGTLPASAGASYSDPWGELSRKQPLLLWEHRFDTPLPSTPACPVAESAIGNGGCWTQYLWVDEELPATDRIEIAIRWAYDGITDLDLYVNRVTTGEQLASSAAVDSNAESVLFAATPGTALEIVVVPTQLFFPGEPIAPVRVELLAQVERALAASSDPLLPNLVSLPPHNFHLSSAANLLPFPENPLLSCYPEETLEDPAMPTRCLRFDQTIANVGAGPLEMRFEMRGVATPETGDDRLLQRIYASDGSFTDRLAGTYEFHTAHAHVHYREFGQSMLFPYDWARGARSGDGTPARIGNKVGFCMIDVLLLDEYWTAAGNGPRTRTFPTCNAPQTDDVMVQGIAVGWADVYGWNLADQYIDVTGLAGGIYELEQVANPNGAASIRESGYDDNVASTVICLLDDAVFEVRSDADAARCASGTS